MISIPCEKHRGPQGLTLKERLLWAATQKIDDEPCPDCRILGKPFLETDAKDIFDGTRG